jgi:serine protease Do
VEQLRAHGRVQRGWIGVQIQAITPEIARSLGRSDTSGVIVAAVAANGPAAKSGLRQGDVILSVDGTTLIRTRDLPVAVANAQAGRILRLRVWRDGEEFEIRATVAPMPEPGGAEQREPGELPRLQPETALGLMLLPLTPTLRQQLGIPRSIQGVIVVQVDPHSPAARDIAPGDIIESINGRRVSDAREAAAILNEATRSPRKTALILINRQGVERYLGLDLG